MTAIDVAELWKRGRSDADVATSLSNQGVFDRASALKRGETDEQIIKYLITKTKNISDLAGSNKSNQRENEGDKQYRESHYGKAAKEYTLAIEYSADRYSPYKSRADACMQYLKAIEKTREGDSPDQAKQALLEKSKMLLCHTIQFDYSKASDLNQKAIAASYQDTYLQSYKMDQNTKKYGSNYIRSTQGALDSRLLNNLERSQKAAIKAGSDIKAAIKDYELVCQTKSKQVR